ncbi:hypothetical protein QYE76_028354 [Lolium multiflorum]|uniref:Transposase (putative) gypsy type domain-containing protein n=1 Tax=Lolium multiflorum TaxID=4521 RepID=A0AAD8QKW0_LOLMU|nr:hypothetical protein QYE76_028354 [Lolium multiflorum]
MRGDALSSLVAAQPANSRRSMAGGHGRRRPGQVPDAAELEGEGERTEGTGRILTVPQSGSTSVLGHTYDVDDDVLLPVPAGSGCSRSSSESLQHDGVVTVVVEISGRASPQALREKKDEEGVARVNERVFTKAWVERGLSLQPSDFFLEVLNTYRLLPHNICPNAYLILNNFANLCEGHLRVCPNVRLLQFFYRVKKETKETTMVNYGSMTFVLRPKRIFPPISSHEYVRYWNAGWFYIKNEIVPDHPHGLPVFINNPLVKKDSWIYIPNLAQHPEMEKMAQRISKLLHEGLTGVDRTLSWFTRRTQPVRFHRRLICAYTGVTRGQVVPEIYKDIYVNGNCPPLNTLAEEDFGEIFLIAAIDTSRADETPEDDEEQTEKYAPRPSKRPRGGSSGADAAPSTEGSAKKPKTTPAGGPQLLNYEWAEHERINMLATSGKGAQPTLPGAVKSQREITTFLKSSPTVIAPNTPIIPPSTSTAAPQPNPADLQSSANPVAGEQAPKEIIPVSNERKDEICSGNFWAAAEEKKDKEEPEVTSADKAEAAAHHAIVLPMETDPSKCLATPKAYAIKLFHKLTEAAKSELQQDLMNSFMNNAWSKADSQSYDIEQYKKNSCEFLDNILSPSAR